ncbi:MAG: UDP-glucose/GDP-mannose dehydrogenase family protein [Treponema sp.]|jgi:UDPglucose 6-dehydrogenase|nr:UDP-glucose/GDP-mannose dehydrogenase family protein [Treponema sp.]
MAEIAIIGAGYVGLVSGACLADFGNRVICVDNDARKIERLEAGEIPIYEPGLEDVVRRNTASGRLGFSASLPSALEKSGVVFIAVGTPPSEDGSADLSHVEAVAREIGRTITEYRVIVDKSTVPVGTGRKVRQWIAEELDRRAAGGIPFDVVSNPEFLREGAAVQDFTHPDRIVIGAETEKARGVMRDVYRALYLNETPYIETNIESAEMIKYASNAFLAIKISFINEVANLCEKVGANVQDVAKAVGRDGRIGGKFLHPGPGYGGSCFPKDTQALAYTGKLHGSPLSLVEAAIGANERQKLNMVEKIERGLGGSVRGKKLAVLGLAFKPNTDDMREAPALVIIGELVRRGAEIRACDPAALKEAAWRLRDAGPAVTLFDGEYDALSGADALVLMTEWNQYRSLDLDRVKALLAAPVFFDLRNVYKRNEVEQKGFRYFAVGQ